MQLSQPVLAVSEYSDPHQPLWTSVKVALLLYNLVNAAAELNGKDADLLFTIPAKAGEDQLVPPTTYQPEAFVLELV